MLLFTRSKKAALFFASSVTSFLFSFPFFSPLLQFQKRWKEGRGEERRRIVGANTNTKPRTGAGRIARRTAFSRSRVAYDRKYRRFPARRPARKVGIFRNYRGRERSTESTSTPPLPLYQRRTRETSRERRRRGIRSGRIEKAVEGMLYVFRSIISDDISRQVLTTGLRSSRLSLLSLYVEEIRSSRREEARRERGGGGECSWQGLLAGAQAGSAPINHRPARLRGQLSSAFASLIVRTCDPSAYTRGSPSPFVLYLSR